MRLCWILIITGTSLRGNTTRRCVTVQEGWLKAARCLVQWDSEMRRALCQKQNGQRNLTSDTFTSWFAARMECQSQPGRDLAHAHSGESDDDFLHDPDIANMAAEDRTRGVWVGVCRNCWSWVTGDQTSHQPMDYFHFAPVEGSGDGEDCLHLELDGGWLLHWSDKACHSPSQYFLCERRTTGVTTSSPISTKSTGKNTEDSNSSDPQRTPDSVEGPSTTPEVPSKQTIILSSVVPAVVVFAVIVLVSVLVTRKRQKTKKSGSQSRNPRTLMPETHGGAELVSPRNLASDGPRSLYDQTADPQHPGLQLAGLNGDYSNLRRSLVQVQDVEPYARLEEATMYERLGPRGQPESECERPTTTEQARQTLAATNPDDGTRLYVNVLGDTGAGTELYVNVSGRQTNVSIGDNGGRPVEQRDYYNLP